MYITVSVENPVIKNINHDNNVEKGDYYYEMNYYHFYYLAIQYTHYCYL